MGLQDAEVRNIVSLLTSTEMTMPEIAQRTGCSRTTIATINRKFQVRDYAGHRNRWALSIPNDAGHDNVQIAER